MAWTAPSIARVDRVDPPEQPDERSALDGFLDFHRATLLHKCAGLDAATLRTRTVPTSTLTLHGLVRHMTRVERWWFRLCFDGQDIAPVFRSFDAAFDDVDEADPEVDFAAYMTECDAARAAAAGRSLDETSAIATGETNPNLRWIYVHMIEEYARHNGHADLIRELIDGTTGE
jgi:uncharacterized damage-inducible protein DinB